MTPYDPDSASAALDAIWARNRVHILVAVAALDDAVLRGVDGRLDDVRRARACGHAHKLAGSAGTFGFRAAGHAARELEHALGAASAPTPDECSRLAQLVVDLRRALAVDPT